MSVRQSRVWTRNRPCPNPCDYRRLAAAVFLRKVNLRVQMPDALTCLFAHPFAVVFHVLCQPFGIAIELPLLVPGWIGDMSLNFGGISIIALPIITATGFRSDP